MAAPFAAPPPPPRIAPTADASDRLSVVPEGMVTSANRDTGATGAAGVDVAAEIGALAAVPPVPVVSVVAFSGAFAPLHAAIPKLSPITQAHFFIETSITVASGFSRTVLPPDTIGSGTTKRA